MIKKQTDQTSKPLPRSRGNSESRRDQGNLGRAGGMTKLNKKQFLQKCKEIAAERANKRLVETGDKADGGKYGKIIPNDMTVLNCCEVCKKIGGIMMAYILSIDEIVAFIYSIENGKIHMEFFQNTEEEQIIELEGD